MNVPNSLYTSPSVDTTAPLTQLPSTGGDSGTGMPFNQVLNDTLMKSTPTAQAPAVAQPAVAPVAGTATRNPVLSVLNFLKMAFIGKEIPLTDSHAAIVANGTVLSVNQQDKSYQFLVQESRSRAVLKATLVFEKQPMGVSLFAYKHNLDEGLKARADMEQRVDSSVTPLMSEDGTASTYSPMTIPPVDKKNNIGEGEPVQYHDPRSDMMMTGRMVIVDRVPYFKEDGMPVTLRAEVTQ